MTVLIILAGLTLAGFVAARLGERAFRDEHLVVVRPNARRTWLFERRGDGRYERLPWTGLPAALCRFSHGIPAVEPARRED